MPRFRYVTFSAGIIASLLAAAPLARQTMYGFRAVAPCLARDTDTAGADLPQPAEETPPAPAVNDQLTPPQEGVAWSKFPDSDNPGALPAKIVPYDDALLGGVSGDELERRVREALVNVRVRDSFEHPVAGAEITVWAPNGPVEEEAMTMVTRRSTDASGAASGVVFPRGRWAVVKVRASGFATHERLISAPGPMAMQITLFRPAPLFGNVIDDASTPIVGARVTIRRRAFQEEQDTTPGSIRHAVTDHAGEFRFDDVEPSTDYSLEVVAPGFGTPPTRVVAPGVRVEVRMSEGREIRGTVVWAKDGTPARHTPVWIETPQETKYRAVLTDALGRFTIADFAPGAYGVFLPSLALSSFDPEKSRMPGAPRVDPGGDPAVIANCTQSSADVRLTREGNPDPILHGQVINVETGCPVTNTTFFGFQYQPWPSHPRRRTVPNLVTNDNGAIENVYPLGSADLHFLSLDTAWSRYWSPRYCPVKSPSDTRSEQIDECTVRLFVQKTETTSLAVVDDQGVPIPEFDLSVGERVGPGLALVPLGPSAAETLAPPLTISAPSFVSCTVNLPHNTAGSRVEMTALERAPRIVIRHIAPFETRPAEVRFCVDAALEEILPPYGARHQIAWTSQEAYLRRTDESVTVPVPVCWHVTISLGVYAYLGQPGCGAANIVAGQALVIDFDARTFEFSPEKDDEPRPEVAPTVVVRGRFLSPGARPAPGVRVIATRTWEEIRRFPVRFPLRELYPGELCVTDDSGRFELTVPTRGVVAGANAIVVKSPAFVSEMFQFTEIDESGSENRVTGTFDLGDVTLVPVKPLTVSFSRPEGDSGHYTLEISAGPSSRDSLAFAPFSCSKRLDGSETLVTIDDAPTGYRYRFDVTRTASWNNNRSTVVLSTTIDAPEGVVALRLPSPASPATDDPARNGD
ncbi:MAG: carboxypeptidase regulatory-like domain-containing protein [Planctomycetes bacterium]|nr:carboxypeptidase regulatory-like domain-containing protein [Planctomycetota bacterium]